MLSDNHESPAAPAEHYDTLATLPPNTSKSDAMDLLLCKLGQLRDLCNTCSAEGDKPIHGVFWLLADTLQCCEQLGGIAFKAVTVAERNTPEQTAPEPTEPTETNVHNDALADSVVIPLANYEKLGLAIETLRAQAIIASDPDTRHTFNERTLEGLGNSIVYEVDRISDLIAGCKTLRATFNHRKVFVWREER